MTMEVSGVFKSCDTLAMRSVFMRSLFMRSSTAMRIPSPMPFQCVRVRFDIHVHAFGIDAVRKGFPAASALGPFLQLLHLQSGKAQRKEHGGCHQQEHQRGSAVTIGCRVQPHAQQPKRQIDEYCLIYSSEILRKTVPQVSSPQEERVCTRSRCCARGCLF